MRRLAPSERALNFSKSHGLYIGRELHIYDVLHLDKKVGKHLQTLAQGSPKASLERESSEFFKSQSIYRGGELGIFLDPKASVERESSEFFQVPELI